MSRLLKPIAAMRLELAHTDANNSSITTHALTPAHNDSRSELLALLEQILASVLFHSSHISEYSMAFTVTRTKGPPPKPKPATDGAAPAKYNTFKITVLHALLLI